MPRLVITLLLFVLSVVARTSDAEAQGPGECLIADPTGTPLNVRTVPRAAGTIVGTLDNGTPVLIQDVRSSGGKPWAYVRVNTGSDNPTGWVLMAL